VAGWLDFDRRSAMSGVAGGRDGPCACLSLRRVADTWDRLSGTNSCIVGITPRRYENSLGLHAVVDGRQFPLRRWLVNRDGLTHLLQFLDRLVVTLCSACLIGGEISHPQQGDLGVTRFHRLRICTAVAAFL